MMLQVFRQCEYIYWRHRWRIALTIILALVARVATWVVGDSWAQPLPGQVLATVSLGLPALVALSVLSLSQDLDLTRRESAFPRDWFVLPVASWRLAVVPIVLLMLVSALLWVMARRTLTDAAAVRNLVLWMTLGSGSWLQWLAWKPVRHPLVRVAGLLLIPLWLSALTLVQLATGDSRLLGLAGLVCFLGGAVAAVAAVKQARTAEVARPTHWREYVTRHDRADRALPAFTGPMAAMRWRDRRQVTCLLPWLGTLSLLVVLVVLASGGRDVPGSLMGILQIPIFVGMLCGTMAGKPSAFEQRGHFPIYLATLPVSTWEMAKARWAAILVAIGQAWLVTLAAVTILIAVHAPGVFDDVAARLNRIDPTHPPWKFAVLALSASLLLTTVAAMAPAWVNAAGRPWLEVVVTLGASGLALAGMAFALWKFPSFASMAEAQAYVQPWQARAPLALGAALAAKIVLMSGVTAFVIRRGLVPAQAIAGFWIFWLVVPIALTCWFGMLLPAWMAGGVGPRWAVMALLTPGASIGLHVAMLDWNRHR